MSVTGFGLGVVAAVAYSQWTDWRMATLGFVVMLAWLVADGLDGMIARSTGTASAVGRVLDGICDHGVFALIYITLAATVNTATGWVIVVAAGIAHALQSNLYESERHRFHRRVRGDSGEVRPVRSGNPFERLYDAFSGLFERFTDPFDRALRRSANPAAMGAQYGHKAAPALHFMALLTANTRVIAIFIACIAGSPMYFWWFELVPQTAIVLIGILWHRRIEALMLGRARNFGFADTSAEAVTIRFQGNSSREGF
ncbi:hypothetical protein BH09PSE4_BH09PSE4_22070 [soil metagenome]